MFTCKRLLPTHKSSLSPFWQGTFEGLVFSLPFEPAFAFLPSSSFNFWASTSFEASALSKSNKVPKAALCRARFRDCLRAVEIRVLLVFCISKGGLQMPIWPKHLNVYSWILGSTDGSVMIAKHSWKASSQLIRGPCNNTEVQHLKIML